jgi:hypothetical protein
MTRSVAALGLSFAGADPLADGVSLLAVCDVPPHAARDRNANSIITFFGIAELLIVL